MYIMCLSKGLQAINEAIADGYLPNKTLGFIPTAGDTYSKPYFVDESRERLKDLDIKLVEIDISKEQKQTLIEKINAVDGIYVAGGNTFFLSQQMQEGGLNKYLADKVKNGFPYFGESAGAVYLSASIGPAITIDNPQDAPDLKNYDGLGLIDFFVLPHVDREKYKTIFNEFLSLNESKLNIVKIRDDQALITTDGKTYKIIPSKINNIK